MSWTCPRCAATSHHPADEANRYCGACHTFSSASDDAATFNAYQFSGRGHEFTCRIDSRHGLPVAHALEGDVLVDCPTCGHRQVLTPELLEIIRQAMAQPAEAFPWLPGGGP
jgi:hypothetical protein